MEVRTMVRKMFTAKCVEYDVVGHFSLFSFFKSNFVHSERKTYCVS